MSSGSSVEDQPVSIGSSESYLGDYYEHLAEEDFRAYPQEVLTARADTHRQIAATRLPGIANIAVRDEADCSVLYIVTDDMPFLVDSVNAELVRQNAPIHLVLHPLFVVTRNRETGDLVKVARVPSHLGISSGDTAAMPNLSHLIAEGDNASHMESWIAVEIDLVGEDKRAELVKGITRVLGDVRAAVEDWPKMRTKALEISADLDRVANRAQIAELRQAQDLLRWLDDGNFTFLGYREYDLVNESGEDVLELREESGLGLLRAGADSRQVQHLTEAGRKKAREKRALVITKANSRSTVHRSAYLDYIGVKSFDAAGNVNGERRFIGLFATTAYAGSVRDIPVVREKVAAVLHDAGFPPDSHSGKDLLGILETYPRDELFQIEIPDLAAIATGIQRLQERRRTRLFLRPDIYGRFMSAVVYLPRDRYTTNVRLRIEQELRETFNAVSIDYEARMTESALARLFFRIRLPKDADVSNVNSDELEKRLVRAARSWGEGISEVLRARGDSRGAGLREDGAKELAAVWAEAFPAGYRVDYEIEDALQDIDRFEKYGAAAERAGEAVKEQPGVHVYLPDGAGATLEEDARVKLYMLEPKSLSQILPYFHNLGLEVLDERPFEIETADHRDFFLYDLGLKYPAGVDPQATGQLLGESFGAAVTGARGVRQLRPAGAAGGHALAPGGRTARLRQVHAANGQHQLLRIPGRHPAGQPGRHAGTQRPVRGTLRPGAQRRRARAQGGRGPRRTGCSDRAGRDPRRRPGAAHVQEPDPGHAPDELLPEQAPPELQTGSVPHRRACRSRGRCSRSGSTRPGSRACTCALARWPAAACAGRTGARTSAPKSWAS